LRTLLGLLVLATAGCNGGADVIDDPVEEATARESELCDGLVGMQGIAWDLYAGVLVTDPVLPPPAPVGGVFSHPDLPLLGFSYPDGWTPEALRGSGVVGVNLLRDDDTAIWRYVSAPANGPLAVETVVDTEIQAARDFYGLTGEGTVVCRLRNTAEVTPGTGIIGDTNHVLVRIEDRSVLLAAQVITVSQDLPPSVFVRQISAPTAEFDARVYDTFLAIDWQLLYGGGRNENDRDGDGIWDVFDNFPDDPERS